MPIKSMITVLLFTTVLLGCRSTSRSAPHSVASHSTVRWGGQKSCPVTGEALGSMGDPIAVKVDSQTIWVCCDGCVAAVKQNPDKFLQTVQDEVSQSQGPAVKGIGSYDDPNSGRVSAASGSCPSCRTR